MPIYYQGPEGYDVNERFRYWFMDNRPLAISIDIETESIDEPDPVGLGVGVSPDEVFYFQVYPELDHQCAEALKRMIPIFADPTIIKVGHNWSFDDRNFPLLPIVGNSLDRTNFWDTMIASRILGNELNDLVSLAPTVGSYTNSAAGLLKGGQSMKTISQVEVANHCMMDCKATFALFNSFKPQIDSKYATYIDVEHKVIPVLTDMSLRGLAIDQQRRQEWEDKITAETALYREICINAGMENPGSNQQVGYVLAKRGNFLPLNKSKRALSTSEDDLEFLDDSLAYAILGYRRNRKLLGTYIKPLAIEERLYTHYSSDTSVFRLSSSRRNVQNIPERVRDIFLPDNGVFTTFDYSQEHLYILHHVSGDRNMRRVYEEGEHGGDIHSFTAQNFFGTVDKAKRKICKTVNYAIIYGADPETIMIQLKSRDLRRAAWLLQKWSELFPDAWYYLKESERYGLRTGWSLPTLFGRPIKLPTNEKENSIKRKAANYPILGSDGEVIKRALLLCNDRKLGPPCMAVTVHDSVTFDGDVKDKLPKEEIEMIPGFRIPVEVKQTIRWE